MKKIQEITERDITYLDIECLQSLITFKWQTYTKAYFAKQFMMLAVYLAALVLDLTAFTYDDYLPKLLCRSVCLSIILYFAWKEIQQLRDQGFKAYFLNDIWNKFDMLLCLNYLLYIAMTMSLFFTDTVPQLFFIKLVEITLILFTFFKLTFYLRIFDQMSFLVQML